MRVKLFSGTIKAALIIFGVAALASCASGSKANEPELLQYSPLKTGEEIAVMRTSMGDIKLRFFPDEAPKAVENFVTLAKNGYYDGVIFHRVIDGFMIQSGDPDGTGMGGESIWGKGFGYEPSKKVRHFRGALAMAHSSLPDSNGSQFYIVQNSELHPSLKTELMSIYDMQDEVFYETAQGKVYYRDVLPTHALDAYIKNGGVPTLDLLLNSEGHTVFGHVIEGMDVVDAIAAVKTIDPANQNDRPVEDVIITSVTFEYAP